MPWFWAEARFVEWRGRKARDIGREYCAYETIVERHLGVLGRF